MTLHVRAIHLTLVHPTRRCTMAMFEIVHSCAGPTPSSSSDCVSPTSSSYRQYATDYISAAASTVDDGERTTPYHRGSQLPLRYQHHHQQQQQQQLLQLPHQQSTDTADCVYPGPPHPFAQWRHQYWPSTPGVAAVPAVGGLVDDYRAAPTGYLGGGGSGSGPAATDSAYQTWYQQHSLYA